jgi:hypothetical protein
MSKRRKMQVRVHRFSGEDESRLLDETIEHWRAQGPAAAWEASFDLLGWWFAARGLDPEAQRVDRTVVQVHPIPWATPKVSVLKRSTPVATTPKPSRQRRSSKHPRGKPPKPGSET